VASHYSGEQLRRRSACCVLSQWDRLTFSRPFSSTRSLDPGRTKRGTRDIRRLGAIILGDEIWNPDTPANPIHRRTLPCRLGPPPGEGVACTLRCELSATTRRDRRTIWTCDIRRSLRTRSSIVSSLSADAAKDDYVEHVRPWKGDCTCSLHGGGADRRGCGTRLVKPPGGSKPAQAALSRSMPSSMSAAPHVQIP